MDSPGRDRGTDDTKAIKHRNYGLFYRIDQDGVGYHCLAGQGAVFPGNVGLGVLHEDGATAAGFAVRFARVDWVVLDQYDYQRTH